MCSLNHNLTPAEYLAEAARFFVSRTKPDSIYADPLFRRKLSKWHSRFDRDVKVELMPDLVLRVRDPKTGEVLAQSVPGQIHQLDSGDLDQLAAHFNGWQQKKATRFHSTDPDQTAKPNTQE